MALVALVGSLCSADIALKKRGYILVDFEHIIIIKNNTLNHPLKIIGIENDDITFEHDIKIKFFENNGKLSSCDRFLELQPESDAIVAVYKARRVGLVVSGAAKVPSCPHSNYSKSDR